MESDDEEENESGTNSVKYSRFGVDVYDPENEFEIVKSVELLDP